MSKTATGRRNWAILASVALLVSLLLASIPLGTAQEEQSGAADLSLTATPTPPATIMQYPPVRIIEGGAYPYGSRICWLGQICPELNWIRWSQPQWIALGVVTVTPMALSSPTQTNTPAQLLTPLDVRIENGNQLCWDYNPDTPFFIEKHRGIASRVVGKTRQAKRICIEIPDVNPGDELCVYFLNHSVASPWVCKIAPNEEQLALTATPTPTGAQVLTGVHIENLTQLCWDHNPDRKSSFIGTRNGELNGEGPFQGEHPATLCWEFEKVVPGDLLCAGVKSHLLSDPTHWYCARFPIPTPRPRLTPSDTPTPTP